MRFWFGSLPLAQWVAFFPADENGSYVSLRTPTWADKLNAIKVWLAAMINEAQPDLWTTLERRDIFLGSTALAPVENAPFSEDEQRTVQLQIAEAKRYLRATHASNLTESQFEVIEAQLNYLAGAASRMGRIDWKNALTGALLGVVLDGLVSHAPIRDLTVVLSRGLAHLFGLPPILALGE